MKAILTRIKMIEQRNGNSNRNTDRIIKLKTMFEHLKNDTKPNDGFFKNGFEGLKSMFE